MGNEFWIVAAVGGACATAMCYVMTIIFGEGEDMKLREMGYEDYGMTREEADMIIKKCSHMNLDKSSEILNIAYETNPMIGPDLYYSIVQDVSYERLDAVKSIPYSKGDFYGYRRKAIAIIKEKVKF